jgi:hypothetical protein
MAQVATTPPVNATSVAKDIRAVNRACEGTYAYRYAPIVVVGASRAAVSWTDLVGLRLALDWILDQQPGELISGYRAAERLDSIFHLLPCHRAEIARALGAPSQELHP